MSGKWIARVGITFFIAFIIGLILMMSLFMYVVSINTSAAPPTSPQIAPVACNQPIRISSKVTSAQNLSTEQTRNAATIIAVGKQKKIPAYGWVIAIATAMQESNLKNLNYGDRDSVGLFQQRAPWGSFKERTTPAISAGMFYTGGRGGQPGLLDISGWQSMSVTQAAQRVQRSAFPGAYAKYEGLANSLVKSLSGTITISTGQACRPVPTNSAWTLPVTKGTYRLTARFGQCSALWSNCHTGLDFAAPNGTPIMAAANGRIVSAQNGGAYGNLTKVQHSNGIVTYYAHQSSFVVRSGNVRAGQVIGKIGATGNTTGPHLHFEVRVNGNPIDPAKWLTDHKVSP